MDLYDFLFCENYYYPYYKRKWKSLLFLQKFVIRHISVSGLQKAHSRISIHEAWAQHNRPLTPWLLWSVDLPVSLLATSPAAPTSRRSPSRRASSAAAAAATVLLLPPPPQSCCFRRILSPPVSTPRHTPSPISLCAPVLIAVCKNYFWGFQLNPPHAPC